MGMVLRVVAVVAGVAVALAVALAAAGEGETLRYQVVSVSGKLMRLEPAPEVRLEVGMAAEPGAVLRTSWRSSAELAVPDRAARFTLRPRTTVRLAAGTPGVLLVVERGTVRAVLDTLAGEDAPERIVTTPSAVLAVRGTEYGVAVSSGGDTTVVVFDGVVEVADLARQGPPVLVAAGQTSRVPRGRLPGAVEPHRVTQREWDRGRVPRLQGDRDQWGSTSSPRPSGVSPTESGRRPGAGGSPRRPG